MTNVTLFNPANVPAFARNNEMSDTARALTGGMGTPTKRLSIKGGVFRLLANGKEIAAIDERHLDVVIVKAAPKISRIFYMAKYDGENHAPPDCWSNDGERPDPAAENKQSLTCIDCEQNKAGSGNGNSRACRYQQRLAVVLANNPEGDVLQVRDLHFSYPDGHAALHGVSFKLCEGDKAALVGPNGAGKSTLMLHLNGILEGRGDIVVSGLGLTRDTLPQIRSMVGLVFQNPDDQLFSPTVFEDVAFGPLHMGLPEAEVRARVDAALEAVRMTAYKDRLSHHLSVGEKKRIAIATVLSMNPGILVLDEPSAGLDPRARRTLINLLRELPITMLVSTHDMKLVQELFPRTIVMDEGRVVADGLTMEILENEVLLTAHGLEKP